MSTQQNSGFTMPYEPHPTCPQPEDANARIWRYLTKSKFLALLDSGQLYFCRVDLFEDPAECSLPPSYVEALSREESKLSLDLYGLTELEWRERTVRDFKHQFYASCWHMADIESPEMWERYGGGHDGVALCSTYTRLIDAFTLQEERVFVGTVRYGDLPPDSFGGFEFVTQKRQLFEVEREVRALLWRSENMMVNYEDLSAQPPPLPPSTPKGHCVPVDLSRLVASVVTSPCSHGSLSEEILSRFRQRGYRIPIVESQL